MKVYISLGGKDHAASFQRAVTVTVPTTAGEVIVEEDRDTGEIRVIVRDEIVWSVLP